MDPESIPLYPWRLGFIAFVILLVIAVILLPIRSVEATPALQAGDTETPTDTPTDTPTETPTETATETPTNTPTATEITNKLDVIVKVENDANDDGNFNDTETVYEKTTIVQYKVTITNDDNVQMRFVDFHDTKFEIGGTCQELEGKKLARGATRSCTFKKELKKGSLPLTNKTTVLMVDPNGRYGWDKDTSTVKYSNTAPTSESSSSSSLIYYTPTTMLTILPSSTPTLPLQAITETLGVLLSSSTPTNTYRPTYTYGTEEDDGVSEEVAALQATGTQVAGVLATIQSDGGGAQQSGVGDTGFTSRLLLWFMFPAVLLLLTGSGLEFYRWLVMRGSI